MRPARGRGRPAHPDVLTPAEWGVLNLVRHGVSYSGIARLRGISVDAVKFHAGNLRAKLGAADRAALAHWHGAPAGSPLAGGDATSSPVPKDPFMSTDPLQLGPIGQISRHVSDIAAAVEWYGKVLGLPHLYTFGTIAFFDCGGTRLFLSQPEKGGVGAESILYFRTPDIQSTFATLSARGVTFAGAPHMIHRHGDGMEEWMAFFHDPDGNMLALMAQMRPSTAA